MLEFRDGTKMNSQVIAQDEVNLHNQEKKAISASWMEVVSKDNLKHKIYTARSLWQEAPLPLPIVYFVLLCKDYIQMSLFPRTPKWEFQNYNS